MVLGWNWFLDDQDSGLIAQKISNATNAIKYSVEMVLGQNATTFYFGLKKTNYRAKLKTWCSLSTAQFLYTL